MSFSVDASTVIVNNPAPYAIDAGDARRIVAG